MRVEVEEEYGVDMEFMMHDLSKTSAVLDFLNDLGFNGHTVEAELNPEPDDDGWYVEAANTVTEETEYDVTEEINPSEYFGEIVYEHTGEVESNANEVAAQIQKEVEADFADVADELCISDVTISVLAPEPDFEKAEFAM